MLAETAAWAGIFILAVHKAPRITLTSAALVLLVHYRRDYHALFTRMQETEARYETTVAEFREHIAQHDATIADLKERNLELESTIKDRDEQISMACEALNQEVIQGKAVISSLRREVEEKTKEAQDWKEYSMYREYPFSARAYPARQDSFEPTSLTGIIAEKTQKIEELKDRLSECHSQLTSIQSTMNSPSFHTKK
ncbi:hypothetical protein H1R20_g1461, partial [Candolleomyces eurysporus]